MKTLIAALIIILALLQIKLWFGNGSLSEVWRFHQAIEIQEKENAALRERNQALNAEVQDLKQGLDAVEERARSELGMIKKDEVFYQVIEE